MDEMELFDLESEFDPLEGSELEDLEDEDAEQQSDYVVPVIPDSELSVVPEPVELPPAERIENLLRGIPGQQFRILRAVSACEVEPLRMEEIIEVVDAEYPVPSSVYSTVRIVQLLEAAGALERIEDEPEEGELVFEEGEIEPEPEPEDEFELEYARAYAAEGATEADPAEADGLDEGEQGEADYVHVERERPYRLFATEAGMAAVHDRISFERVRELVEEDERYAPVYKRILEMCDTAEGRMIREINAVVDPDPICKNPRRYSQYFLSRLENVNAVRWDDTWFTTDFGRQALALGVLEQAEACGDIAAAEAAKQKELEKQAEFERQAAERAAFAAEKAAREAEEAAARAAAEAGEAGEPDAAATVDAAAQDASPSDAGAPIDAGMQAACETAPQSTDQNAPERR